MKNKCNDCCYGAETTFYSMCKKCINYYLSIYKSMYKKKIIRKKGNKNK